LEDLDDFRRAQLAAVNKNCPTHSSDAPGSATNIPLSEDFRIKANWLVIYRIYRILNHIKIMLNIIKPYLVGGIPTPLKNDGVSQFGMIIPN
jgi:hypothetical protein